MEFYKKIILELSAPNNDFILICEDDHLFTDDYSTEILKKGIGITKILLSRAAADMGDFGFVNAANAKACHQVVKQKCRRAGCRTL